MRVPYLSSPTFLQRCKYSLGPLETVSVFAGDGFSPSLFFDEYFPVTSGCLSTNMLACTLSNALLHTPLPWSCLRKV